MNNYRPKYAVGTVYHKLNDQTRTANAWGDWDPEKFTVEDSAFGFVVMENGATISIDSSWALNYADAGEAQTLICGTKAGADMPNDQKLRINGVNNGRQYITVPDFAAGGVDFFSGSGGIGDPGYDRSENLSGCDPRQGRTRGFARTGDRRYAHTRCDLSICQDWQTRIF